MRIALRVRGGLSESAGLEGAGLEETEIVVKAFACRCEDVTLFELDKAIDDGYRDIESLKRYTGFGTGICQGKWCLALCASRLAEKGGDARQPMTPRPPTHPIRFATLAALADLEKR